MKGSETCTAIAKISKEQMVSSNVCYTNRGMLEVIVSNESSEGRRFYYEVRNFYSDYKLAAGVVEAKKTENFCVKISEDIHLVQAAYIIISSLCTNCSGFACLRGVIDYDNPEYFNQAAYHQVELEIALTNHLRKIAK